MVKYHSKTSLYFYSIAKWRLSTKAVGKDLKYLVDTFIASAWVDSPDAMAM